VEASCPSHQVSTNANPISKTEVWELSESLDHVGMPGGETREDPASPIASSKEAALLWSWLLKLRKGFQVEE
jgi:hypothetical protein